MKDRVAAGNCVVERRGIAEVASGSLGVQAFQIFQVAGRAHEQAQVSALRGQNARDVGAEESGGACEKGFQEQFSVFNSQSRTGLHFGEWETRSHPVECGMRGKAAARTPVHSENNRDSGS